MEKNDRFLAVSRSRNQMISMTWFWRTQGSWETRQHLSVPKNLPNWSLMQLGLEGRHWDTGNTPEMNRSVNGYGRLTFQIFLCWAKSRLCLVSAVGRFEEIHAWHTNLGLSLAMEDPNSSVLIRHPHNICIDVKEQFRRQKTTRSSNTTCVSQWVGQTQDISHGRTIHV